MKVVKICGRIVIVTGPISSGKSSLCKAIARAYPYGASVIVPFERKGKKGEEQITHFLEAQKILQENISSKVFTVINARGITKGDLQALLISLGIMGDKGNISVIKIDLSEKLHDEFWKMNPKFPDIKLKTIRTERRNFNGILRYDYSADNVSNIVITDPRDVKFEFAK